MLGPTDTFVASPLPTPLASTANPAAAQGNVKPAAVGLTKKQLDYFRDLLLRKRAEIVGDVRSMESGALRGNESGDLSHAPMHMADVGTDTFDQEFTLRLAASEREQLAEIDAALKRINDGTFGVCEVTGHPITLPRLEAKPWARVCIEVARERDRFHQFHRHPSP